MAYRITAGSFEEMVVELDALGGEFEPIPEVEWTKDQEASAASRQSRSSPQRSPRGGQL